LIGQHPLGDKTLSEFLNPLSFLCLLCFRISAIGAGGPSWFDLATVGAAPSQFIQLAALTWLLVMKGLEFGFLLLRPIARNAA